MVNVLRFFIVIAVSAVFSFAPAANAQVAVEGGSGLYTVEKAGTLGDMAFAISGFYTYDYFGKHGIEVYENAQNISLTFGIGETFEISAYFKNVSHEREGDFGKHAYYPYVRVLEDGDETVEGMVDSVAKAKWNFFSSSKHNIDISAEVMVTLPVGDEELGLGTGEVSGGGALLLDKNYNEITWHFNVGYLNLDFPELGLAPLFTYGAGFEYFPISNVSVIGEMSGYAWTELDSWREDAVRTSWGARYYIGEWGSLTAGYAAWTAGAEPNYLYTLGLTVVMGGKGRGAMEVEADGQPMAVPETVGRTQITIVLESVHFAFDKSLLTEKAKAILSGNAERLLGNPEATFAIEGNTCSIGANGYNYQLGLRRAIAAKKYLMSLGVYADRMMIISYGEERPTHDNSTRAGRSQNRRVDFVIEVK